MRFEACRGLREEILESTSQVNNADRRTHTDGNVTSFTYNADGQVLTTTTPLGTTTNVYDDAGNLTSTTDATGRQITYAYDGDQLTTETWYNADASVANVKTYTYDDAGNTLTASDNSGTYTFTYDGDRVLTQTDPNGITLTFTYDEDGNTTSISDSQGGVATMTYNASGQVTSKTYQDANTQLRVDFAYDLAGNITTETRYSDVAGTQLAGTTSYTYSGKPGDEHHRRRRERDGHLELCVCVQRGGATHVADR